jgi:hypothetical protein
MVHYHSTTGNNSPFQWKLLLGKNVDEIIPFTGEPFASYIFNNEEVFLFDTSIISTVVARNGKIVRCDDLTETRRTLRVNLSEKIPFMIVGVKNATGYLKDLSIAGAALELPGACNLAIGTRIGLSLAIPLEGISRHLRISCRIHDIRGSGSEKTAVVLFDLTDTPWKKLLLSRYIQLNVLHTEYKSTVFAHAI